MTEPTQMKKDGALLVAISRENVMAVERALNDGANPNTVTPNGTTALMFAAGNTQIFEILLIHGAKMHAVTNAGGTVLSKAIELCNEQTALKLIKAGVDISTPDGLLDNAAKNDMPLTCKALLKRGVFLEETNAAGKTPLITALENTSDKAGLVLLQQGASARTIIHSQLQFYHLEALRKFMTDQMNGMLTSKIPKPHHCIKDGELTDAVLNACVLGEFGSRIALPLMHSGNQRNIALVKEILQQLPQRWRKEYPNIFTEFAKVLGNIEPAPGLPETKIWSREP